MKKDKKNIWVYLIYIIIVLSLIIFVSANPINKLSMKNSYVASINGEKISVDEFNLYLYANRSKVYSYFNNKYNAEYNDDFWTHSFNGEIPIEKLKENSLRECEKAKAQQILAKKKGIIDDISYSKFLKTLSEENKNRKKAVDSGEVIYGPIQYDEYTYFDDRFTKMVIKLKNTLVEDGEISFVDAELLKYYDQIKKDMFVKGNEIEIHKISIPYCSEGEEVNDLKIQEAKKQIQLIVDKIKNGENFELVAKTYNPDVESRESCGLQKFNDKESRKYSLDDILLLKEAEGLSVNEISKNVVEANSSYNIIKCIKKVQDSYKSFEDVKEEVKLRMIDKKYDDLVEKFLQNASIAINKNFYNKIKID